MANAREIDAKAVAQLLHDAGAPLICDVNKLEALTEYIRRIPEEIERRDRETECAKLTSVYERAHNAASDLRRYLLEIAKFEEKIARHFDWPDHKESAEQLRAFVETIPNVAELPSAHSFEPKHPSFYSPTKLWQGQAWRLFNAYQNIYGPCGISRDGPAAKFIKAVFARLGVHTHVEQASIANQVRRLTKELASSD